MYIYIATAFISLILIKISLVLCKKNKILSIVFEILALTIPCVIAALRDYSVGTDVLFYQKPYFDDALYSDNLLNYLHTEGHNVEQLYFLLTWVCAKLSNRMSLLFFCIEALIIVPVYISLKMYMKKDNDLILGIFIFFTFWYNCSLNMARQSIALAFCILTFACLEQNKNKKAILDNNKYNNNFKNIYSIITLKSKNNRKNKIIEDNTLEKENVVVTNEEVSSNEEDNKSIEQNNDEKINVEIEKSEDTEEEA